MKRVLIFLSVMMLSLATMAQGPFDGFFNKKSGTAVLPKADGDKTQEWYFRPAANLTAIQFTYNKEIKAFEPATFSSAGIGLGYQHYVEHAGVLTNNYGFNALVMLDASQLEAGIAAVLTTNIAQFVNVGAGYNFTNKQFLILTGCVWTF